MITILEVLVISAIMILGKALIMTLMEDIHKK
jgi:hypothetical protein